MEIRKMEFGPWHVNVCDEPAIVSRSQADDIARFLTQRYLPVAMKMYRADYPVHTYGMIQLGVPSPVVRLDMPPMNGHWPGMYEVEGNPAAFGIAERMGLGLTQKIAQALQTLGIHRLGYGVAASRAAQTVDLQIFMEALAQQGIETLPIDLAHPGDEDLPLWLRAGHEDLDQVTALLERCLLCHYHGGGHKRYLYELDDAVALASFDDPIAGPFARFPDGFAVKPDGGWGTMVLHTWCPNKPWKDKGLSPGAAWSVTSLTLSGVVRPCITWFSASVLPATVRATSASGGSMPCGMDSSTAPSGAVGPSAAAS